MVFYYMIIDFIKEIRKFLILISLNKDTTTIALYYNDL